MLSYEGHNKTLTRGMVQRLDNLYAEEDALEQEYARNAENIWPIEYNLKIFGRTMRLDYKMKQEEALKTLKERQEWIEKRCMETFTEKADITGLVGRVKCQKF